MNFDPEALRQHYASLSDDALMAIDTADLVEIAKRCYDEEVSRRGLPMDIPVAGEDVPTDSNAHLRNVRTAALVACVAAVLGLLIPTWTSVQRMLAMNANDARWWIPLVTVFTLIFSALLPSFYFAVYRDRGDLQISRNLRRLSVGAALVLALLLTFRVSRWIESFKPSSVLSQSSEPWTMDDTSVLLGVCFDLGTIILLIALSRQRERNLLERPVSILIAPVSMLLRITTRISVVVFGATTAIAIIRLALTPYWSARLRDALTQAGRTPPPSSYFVMDSFRTVLVQACSLAVPFVVWCASPKVRSDKGESSI